MTQLAEAPTASTMPQLYSSGKALNPARVGQLHRSALSEGMDSLRATMQQQGYLFLPGLLNRHDVLEGRREMVRRLSVEGALDPAKDPMDAVMKPGSTGNFRPDLTKDNAPLLKVLYDGPLIAFFTDFLMGQVRHYDFTWLRAIGPGHGTRSHVDSVYMNRGSQNVYTTWVPLGDVTYDLGGLMILEGTNNNERLKETYGKQDIDSYCTNKTDAHAWGKSWGTGGQLKGDPNQIRKAVGGDTTFWRTAEFQAGDALIFTIHTVHASLDNTTADRIRFSSDTRYQLASEPVDDRWVGENPPAHGPAGKRGKIC